MTNRERITLALIGAAMVALGFTVTQLGDPVLSKKEEIANTIAAAQDAYYAGNGRYFQALRADSAAEMSAKPHYQTKSLTELTGISEDLPFEIEVHQYSGPRGDGYQIFIYEGDAVTPIGFGGEAESRTKAKPPSIATSTP